MCREKDKSSRIKEKASSAFHETEEVLAGTDGEIERLRDDH